MSSNRLFALGGLLCALGFACLTQAQVPMTGAGKGTPAVSAAYVGPGDLVTPSAPWWGFRCFTVAYNGNVALIESPSDALSTTISCNGAGVLSYSGTAIGTTCSVSCTVKTLYDQSGTSLCSAACDVTQATEASRPTFTNNCQNSRPCMASSGVQVLTSPNLASSRAQPLSVSSVSKWDGTGSSAVARGASGGGSSVMYYDSGTHINIYGGAVLFVTISTNTLYAAQGIFDEAGAGSSLYVNGSSTTGSSSFGAWNSGVPLKVGADNSGGGVVTLYEVGWWYGAFNGTQQSNINTNQRGAANGWNF